MSEVVLGRVATKIFRAVAADTSSVHASLRPVTCECSKAAVGMAVALAIPRAIEGHPPDA